MKNKVLALFVFAIVFFAFSENSMLHSQAYKSYPQQYNAFVSSIELPKNMDFCGERVPLEVEEVRERVEREFYLLLQQQGQVILYLKRSGRYFPVFEKILKEQNMPDDLKYLSVAESALFMSRSGKGAMGLWQFMEGTARSHGMTVNEFVDERRNVIISTYAACKYLRTAHIKFNSWISAAASYNMGMGGLNENMTYQGQNNYFDLFLNEETSRYIFRIVVIKELMKNPEKYGFVLKKEQLYKPHRVKLVKEENAIPNLAQWAKAHGTTYKDVKLLNPWILKRELPAPKGKAYEIAIPY